MIEVLGYIFIGYLFYRLGSLILVFNLCIKVANQLKQSNNGIPDTPEVKELQEIAGKEFVEDMYNSIER